jgi:hypothetical protein
MVVAENLPLFSKERDRERERESGGWNKNKHKTSAIVGTDLFVPVLLHVCPEWHDINTKHQPKRTTHADNNGERVSEMAFFVRVRKGLIWKDLKKGCSKICLSYIENEYDTFEATCNSTRRRLPWHLQKLILQCRVCWLVSFCRCHHSSMLTD